MNKSYAFIAIDSVSCCASCGFVALVVLVFVALVVLVFVALVVLVFVALVVLVFVALGFVALGFVALGFVALVVLGFVALGLGTFTGSSTSISGKFVRATALASIESASTRARNFALYLRFRGFVLSL